MSKRLMISTTNTKHTSQVAPPTVHTNNIVMVRKRIYWEYFHWPALALKSSGMDWNTDGSVSFLARVWIVE